ncbi:hypothetical protein MMMDOFMJ_2782 [Methylobacterium gnaphalii]|uniref:Uncharacterized protein n=1 Tax=Methylobacterium gnaphalii TaxID=1010610 RepID=A0A512JIF3_9HYPH|nr:hypothetical protein MGN01_15850 [Methylobacterium gnaphalii]GJD69844.1 hypothetical protein MMMDOFMJ_2782 [Methylobacterium gnaphalii]GLS50157.1 hypothetical protein GCM10007885_30090 [Methylobacterium gnaphalii]
MAALLSMLEPMQQEPELSAKALTGKADLAMLAQTLVLEPNTLWGPLTIAARIGVSVSDRLRLLQRAAGGSGRWRRSSPERAP